METETVKTVKHTPLPWSINRYREVDNPYKIILYASAKRIALCFKEDSVIYHDELEAEANAEFIVRACNSHYELLEALKNIMNICHKIDSGDIQRTDEISSLIGSEINNALLKSNLLTK